VNQIAKTTARKLLSFYEDPSNTILISDTASSVYGETYNPLLWFYIFVYFFGKKPKKYDGKYDPNWDYLLHEMKALDAHVIVLRLLRRRKNRNIALKRKVA